MFPILDPLYLFPEKKNRRQNKTPKKGKKKKEIIKQDDCLQLKKGNIVK